MVGMLVWVVGGHGMVSAPKLVVQVDPFWTLVCLQRGPQGQRLLGGTFQIPIVVVKGPEGPHLLAGFNLD